MLNNIIFEQDCDKRLAEFKYNAKEKYYKLVKSLKLIASYLVWIKLEKFLLIKIKILIMIMHSWY